MTYRIPLWVRALLAADRIATRAQSVREGLRDELLLAWIDPSHRASLTAALYAHQSTYLPGGHRFRSGLFAWERRALESPLFPRSGRLLLGASGAGRELVALLERGFDIVAFDPCAEFADAARRVATGTVPNSALVFQASYDDLISAVEGRGGPLASTLATSFDAVLLGWGSLSHVTPFDARLALLRALRVIAPRAPILASFALEPDSSSAPGSKGRVRDALRRLFAAMGAPGVSETGDHFYPDAGFFALLAQEELLKLAFDAGYEVSLFEESPYPHAIFTPLASPSEADFAPAPKI